MVNEQPQVGYILKQAQSLLRLRMEEALHELELSVSQYSCLHALRREPGISAAVLARRTFVTRQSMNAMLQQLLERGLVARPAQVDSGRALPAELTRVGSATLDRAETVVTDVEQRMLSGLSATESASLARGLLSCVAALGG